MRSLVFGILLLAFGLARSASAGEIEINGKWVSFQDIISGNGSFPGEWSGHALNTLPARILGLTGSSWTGVEASHLSKRFWPLANIALTAKDQRPGVLFVVRYNLVPAFQTNRGTYEFDFRILENRRDTFAMFDVIADATEQDSKDYIERRCVEFRGHITWLGTRDTRVPKASQYTYIFIVDSVNITGKMPRGFLSDAPPVPNLENATKLCSPEK